jgi:hypothetical protein
MFQKLLDHREHIPPHRVWAFLVAEVQLSLPENVHLIHCNDCRKFHDVCLRSESFGEALDLWLEEENPTRESFDPSPEDQNVVLIDEATLRKVEKLILGCEACSEEEDLKVPFDNMLDRITGNNPAITDYILREPAKCPRCRNDVREKTLVEFDSLF